MPSLSELIAKARGQEEPRKRFTLPPPAERCHVCGSDCFVREPDQNGWSCLGCALRAGRKFPRMEDGDGWQGVALSYE